MDDYDNRHDELLKNMLIEDREQLEREKKRKEQEAMEREMMLNEEFNQIEDEDEEWWKKENELDHLEE